MSILDTAKEAVGVVGSAVAGAVAGAAVRLAPDRAADPSMVKHGALGSSLNRVDGPVKVMGRARFAAEVVLDDMTYAALVYSTIARGRIAALDLDAAERALGVVLVMT